MKKILSLLTLSVLSVATVPQINFTNASKVNSNINYGQKNIENSSAIKTVINKNLNKKQTSEEDTKKYLIEYIDDANLRVKIQTELASIVHQDDYDYFIYENDVDTVVSLDLSESDIGRFKGLEFFPNLKSLNISGNKQTVKLIDFQLIFRKIEKFDMSKNLVDGIDIIMYFTSLKELTVAKMNMEEDFVWISLFLPLSHSKTLTKLNLSNNKNISDISLLGKIKSLNELNLSINNIVDISSLSTLSKLTNLDLTVNHISDISSLSTLSKLTNLDLTANHILDFSPLSSLPNLTSLDLGDNNISDISFLSSLINLTSLNLRGNNISDFSPLNNLSELTNLNLELTNISDISFLGNLINIEKLDLRSNKISDISPLANLINLTNLDLGRNYQMSDISSLKSLTNLTDLVLYLNEISDISPLANLINLTNLELGLNNISDISPLRNLIKLKILYLDYNRIPNTDEAWSVLHKLPNYDPKWDNEEVRKSQKTS